MFGGLEASDLNMDDFMNIDTYLGDSNTPLLMQDQKARGDEETYQLSSFGGSTSSESGSQSTWGSPSIISDRGFELPGMERLAIDANEASFFDQAVSWDNISLVSDSWGHDLTAYIPESTPIMPSAMNSMASAISPEAPIQPGPDVKSSPVFPEPLRTRRRRNPEALKKNQRKITKPEVCHICGKGHTWIRELNRHMVTNHREEAARMNLDLSKTKCKYCDVEFDNIRKDRVKKHVKKVHGISL